MICQGKRLQKGLGECSGEAIIRVRRHDGQEVDVPVCGACLTALKAQAVQMLGVDALKRREDSIPVS